MRTCALLLACLLLALPAGAVAQGKKKAKKDNAAAATLAPESGYRAFRMVRLKNIFDPDRRPMPAEGSAKAAATSSPVSKNSHLVLTGTLVTETKRLAFFTGSQASFNKVVTANEKVGDLVVAAISMSHVELKRGDQEIILPVGKQVTLGEKAEVSAASGLPTSLSTPSTLPSDSGRRNGNVPAPTAEIGAPPDAAEVMRRMMERRQKEIR
jgi:hypothetical protein